MSAPAAAGMLRSLTLALLLASPPAARAWDADARPALPATAATEARARARAPRQEDERESPPKRALLEDLESLASHAAAPQADVFRPLGMGAAGLDWTFLGPRPMTGEYWSSNQVASGRVCSIAPHPVNANIVYAAAAQGGVWKTTDGGTTWNPLTESLPSLSSGALAIDQFHPDTVWYGTGEANGAVDCFYGDGLYRSLDEGATWGKVATAAQVGSYIARVVLERGASDTLFVGGSRGFVRSLDGGASWTLTLSGRWCDDVVASPATPTNLCCTLNARGVYRSTDAGTTWLRTLILPGRTSLAISPSNPDVLYASASSGNGRLYGMYRSSDGGSTWTTLTGTPDFLDGQGWYDNVVAVSPGDSATVIAGGVYPYASDYHGVLRSTDAGATWTDVTMGTDNLGVHPDQHALAFGPDGTLWLGNDGGVWKTTDLGGHWTDCNATLGTTQFYTVAAHPTDPGSLLGGTQDNGTVRFAGTEDWPVVISGDGGPSLYQRLSPSHYYTSYVALNPIYAWSDDDYAGEITGGWPAASDRVDWANAPFLEDPGIDGTFYAGTQRVWKTSNAGLSWAALSPDLTRGGVLRSMAVSPQNSNLLWTGASDGALRRSRDGGVTWTQGAVITVAIPTIVASPTDTAAAYLCLDVSTGPRVVRTSNGGSTVTSVAGNLPAGVRGLSLAVDWRTVPERLYLGTDYGVYASFNGGATWFKAGAGMPSVSVPSMVVDLANSKLVAATHGRGMWRADLDVAGPTLALTSPVGGESWLLGTPSTITWTASDPSGVSTVDLALSLDGGTTYPTAIATGIANTGSYSWTAGPVACSTARVRVIATDGLGQPSTVASAADFAIVTSAGVEDLAVAPGMDPVTPNVGQGPFCVGFAVPSDARVAVGVYDAAGRHVRSLAEGAFGPGRHSLLWDGRDVAGAPAGPGVYFIRLRTRERVFVRRVAVMR